MDRLDFRRFLESGLRSSGGVSAGSFPEQRLVIEPRGWRKAKCRQLHAGSLWGYSKHVFLCRLIIIITCTRGGCRIFLRRGCTSKEWHD